MPARGLEIARGQRPALPVEHARRTPARLFAPGAALLLILLGAVSGFLMGVAVTIGAESAARGARRIQPVTAVPMAAPPAGPAGVSRAGFEGKVIR